MIYKRYILDEFIAVTTKINFSDDAYYDEYHTMKLLCTVYKEGDSQYNNIVLIIDHVSRALSSTLTTILHYTLLYNYSFYCLK